MMISDVRRSRFCYVVNSFGGSRVVPGFDTVLLGAAGSRRTSPLCPRASTPASIGPAGLPSAPAETRGGAGQVPKASLLPQRSTRFAS